MDHLTITYVLSFVAGSIGGMSYILTDREVDTKREVAAGIIRPGCVGLAIALTLNNWLAAPLMIGSALLAGMAGEAGFTIVWKMLRTAALRFIKASIQIEEPDPWRRRYGYSYRDRDDDDDDDDELEEWPNGKE